MKFSLEILKKRNIIIRILGNDLEQIHGYDQTYENLKFTLENESEFINTDKLFVLNKILPDKKKKLIDLLNYTSVHWFEIEIEP